MYIGRPMESALEALKATFNIIQSLAMANPPIPESGRKDGPTALIIIGNDLVHLFTCRYSHVCCMGSRTLTAHCCIPSSYNGAQDMAGNQ